MEDAPITISDAMLLHSFMGYTFEADGDNHLVSVRNANVLSSLLIIDVLDYYGDTALIIY